jgi:predicted RNase H-like HicB family nuclease
MIFHVTIEAAEDGWIVAECPALPGCVSQGRSDEVWIPQHKELSIGTLRSLIRSAGLTVDEFLDLL